LEHITYFQPFLTKIAIKGRKFSNLFIETLLNLPLGIFMREVQKCCSLYEILAILAILAIFW
jgi:hypothetical protein